jgi:hypothetical protein
LCGVPKESQAHFVKLTLVSRVILLSRNPYSQWRNQRRVFVRAYCCDACKQQAVAIQFWTILTGLCFLALPFATCFFCYAPMSRAHANDPQFGPGTQQQLFLTLASLVVPFVVALIGSFGVAIWRVRSLTRLLQSSSLKALESLGFTPPKISFLSFWDAPPKGTQVVDLTEKAV